MTDNHLALEPKQISGISFQQYIERIKQLSRKPQFARSWQKQKLIYQALARQPFKTSLQQIDDEESINNQKEKNNKNEESKEEKKDDLNSQFQNKEVQNKQKDSSIKVKEKKSLRQKIEKSTDLGIEFDDVVLDEEDLVKYIIRNHYYIMNRYLTEEQLTEFAKVFKDVNQIDGRNIAFKQGSIIGMTMLGVLGFIALGFSVVGVIAGGVLGVIMGRYAGKYIKRTLKRRQNKLIELDIFEIRLRCLIKWAKIQTTKYKYNINLLRFIIEKLILEIKPALHYRYFPKSLEKQLRVILNKVVNVLKDPIVTNTLLLSFKLCQEYWTTLSDPIAHQKIHPDQIQEFEIALLKTVDNILKPLNTLLSLDNVKKGTPLHELQKRISKFLIQPSIVNLGINYPDPQMSLLFIKLFVNKMKTPIQFEDLQNCVEEQNFRQIENIGLLIGQEQVGKPQQNKQFDIKPIYEQPESISLKDQEEEEEEKKVDNFTLQDDQDDYDFAQQVEININHHKSFVTKPSIKMSQKDVKSIDQEQFEIDMKNLDSNKQQIKGDEQLFKIDEQSQNSQNTIKLSLKQHPNKANLMYLFSRVGDLDIMSASPYKKNVRNIQDSEKISTKDVQQYQNQDVEQPNNELISLPYEDKAILQKDTDIIIVQKPSNKDQKNLKSNDKQKQIPQEISQQIKEPIYDKFITDRFANLKEILEEPYEIWEKVTNKDQILIYKRMLPGSISVFVKGEAFIPSVPKHIVMKSMCEQEHRCAWDKILAGFTVHHSDRPDLQYIYFYAPAPVPIVSTREFLQARVTREDFPKKGETCLLFYSVELPYIPVKKGNIRAHTEVAGYVLENQDGGTLMKFVSNNDIKGSVPKMLVNYGSTKAPFAWFGNLRKASLQLYQQELKQKKP